MSDSGVTEVQSLTRRGIAIALSIVLVTSMAAPFVGMPVGVAAAVDGDVDFNEDASSPPIGTELEPGKEYSFDIVVDYQLPDGKQGSVQLYIPDIGGGYSTTKEVEGTGEYEEVTFSVTETVPQDLAGDSLYMSTTVEGPNGDTAESDEATYPVGEGENSPPAIEDYSPSQDLLKITAGETIDFSAESSDADGDSLTHTWHIRNIDEEDSFSKVETESGSSTEFSHTFDESGSYAVKVKVSDGSTSNDHVWNVEVSKENQDRPPTIERISPSDSSINIEKGASQLFEVEVSDPDSDLETVEYSLDGEVVHTHHLGSDSTQRSNWEKTFDGSGSYTVEATVTDSNGNTDSLSWSVSVETKRPDLEVIDVEWRPSSPSAGEIVEYRLTIRNDGESEVGSLETEVQVDGELVAVPPTMDLGPGETAKSVWTGSHEISAGEHTVVGIVDADDHKDESNENNNRHTESLQVESSKGRIEGQVTDTDGNPLEGARVYLDDNTDARTNADGEYSFEDVTSGNHELYVSAGACYETPTKTVTVQQSQTTTTNFRLEPKEYTIELSSEPVSVDLEGTGTYDCGAEVQIQAPKQKDGYNFQAWKTPDGEVVSENPTFTLDYLTQNYNLIAQYKQSGQPDLVVQDIRWEPSQPQEGDGVTLHVDVSNRGEARVSHAGIETTIDGNVYRRDIELEAGGSKTITISDAWTASGNDQSVTAEIDYGGDVTEESESNNGRSETISVERAEADLTVTDIEWRPGNPSDGQEVEFRLTIKNKGGQRAESIESEVFVDGESVAVPPTVDLDPEEEYTTPWTGSFTASKGTHQVTGVVDPDNHKDENNENNNRKSESITVGSSTGEIEGTVTTVAGEPIDGATVSLDTGKTTQTDKDGSYTLTGVASGQHTITVETQYGEKEADVTVEADETSVRDFEFDPNLPDLKVTSIRLKSESPQPTEEATFIASIENTGEKRVSDVGIRLRVEGEELARKQIDLSAGDSKTVEFVDTWVVESGTHDVSATVDPTGQVEEQSENQNQLTETVNIGDSTGVVQGAVVDSSGRPVSDATVRLGDKTVTTDEEGRFRFDSVVAGSHSLVVSKQGFKTVETAISVEAGETAKQDITLNSGTGGTISISGVPDTYVKDKWYPVQVKVRNTGQTDQTFTVELMEPTGTDIQGSATREIQVDAGDTETIEYQVQFYGTDTTREVTANIFTESGDRLDTQSVNSEPRSTPQPERGNLEVLTVDGNGEAIKSTQIKIVGETTKTKISGQNGEVSFPDIQSGTYAVEATHQGEEKTRTVIVPSDDTKTVTLRFEEEAVPFRGVVNTQEGSRVKKVTVSVAGESVKVDDSGQFSFDSEFSPGEYSVEIRAKGELLKRTTVSLQSNKNSYKLQAPPPSESTQQLVATVSEMYVQHQYNTGAGAVWGEYGVENPNSIFLAGVDTKSIPYFAGWLGVSVLPVLDAPADVRDCLVKNDKQVWNGVDCGGAAISSISSLAAFGIITTGPGLAADIGEDISDVLSITRRFLLHAPSTVIDNLAQFFAKLPGSFLDDVATKAEADSVIKVIRRAQLRNAGFSASQIDEIASNEKEVTTALSRSVKLADNGISPDSITAVSRKGTVSQTRTVVDKSDQVIWLEKGNSQKGWQHILNRHESQFYDMKSISSRNDIQEAIQTTIQNGRRSPLDDSRGGYAYQYEPTNGKTMTVFVSENGYIFTARPGAY